MLTRKAKRVIERTWNTVSSILGILQITLIILYIMDYYEPTKITVVMLQVIFGLVLLAGRFTLDEKWVKEENK